MLKQSTTCFHKIQSTWNIFVISNETVYWYLILHNVLSHALQNQNPIMFSINSFFFFIDTHLISFQILQYSCILFICYPSSSMPLYTFVFNYSCKQILFSYVLSVYYKTLILYFFFFLDMQQYPLSIKPIVKKSSIRNKQCPDGLWD